MNFIRTFIFMAFLFVIFIILQIFLARRKNKWLGLILPIISFMLSLLAPLNLMANGKSTREVIAEFLMSLIFPNIPTIIYVLIYFICRDKYNKKKEMDKIDIQDLH